MTVRKPDLSQWQPGSLICHNDSQEAWSVTMTVRKPDLSQWWPGGLICHNDGQEAWSVTMTARRPDPSQWWPGSLICHNDSQEAWSVTMTVRKPDLKLSQWPIICLHPDSLWHKSCLVITCWQPRICSHTGSRYILFMLYTDKLIDFAVSPPNLIREMDQVKVRHGCGGIRNQ